MRKIFAILSILLVAVFTSACVNNLAVQELNNKAKEFADKGDYTQAIERLKSSLDLDSTRFETHYNLATVYTQVEDYVNAVDEYKQVIKIKPDDADSYYSLGTTENNLAVDIQQKTVRLNDEGGLVKVAPDSDDFDKELTQKEKDYISELYDSAIDCYNKYLDLKPDASDKKDVLEQIEKIKNRDSKKQAEEE